MEKTCVKSCLGSVEAALGLDAAAAGRGSADGKGAATAGHTGQKKAPSSYHWQTLSPSAVITSVGYRRVLAARTKRFSRKLCDEKNPWLFQRATFPFFYFFF